IRIANHPYSLPRPAPTGGAYRDRHGRGVRDAMDALARETSAARGGRRSRVVLMPRRWHQALGDEPGATEANKPGTPGRARSKPEAPLRRECRLSRLPCCCLACARVHFLCTQGSRVRPAPGIPCALFVRGRNESTTRADAAARMRGCVLLTAASLPDML